MTSNEKLLREATTAFVKDANGCGMNLFLEQSGWAHQKLLETFNKLEQALAAAPLVEPVKARMTFAEAAKISNQCWMQDITGKWIVYTGLDTVAMEGFIKDRADRPAIPIHHPEKSVPPVEQESEHHIEISGDEANRVAQCIDADYVINRIGSTMDKNRIGNIANIIRAYGDERQESAWRDVRRAALEEAAAINIDGYETPFEPSEDINLGVAGGMKIYRDAILNLIDTPPKPEGAKYDERET